MGAAPPMNRSAKGGTRSSLHYGGEGVLIHPPHQGVCGRHGTEEQCVTSGGLTGSPDGTGVSGPISASEMASDALWPADGGQHRNLMRHLRPDACEAAEQRRATFGGGGG